MVVFSIYPLNLRINVEFRGNFYRIQKIADNA